MNARRPVRAKPAGFTLFEVLIALALIGMAMTAIAAGLRFGLAASDAQSHALGRAGELDAVDRLFRGLVAGMAPDGGADGHSPALEGREHTLAFLTLVPEAAGFQASPAGDAEVALGMDRMHRLVLRLQPAYRNPLGPPAAAVQSALAGGIDHVDFAYWLPGGGGGTWVRRWSGHGLPGLVRLRVVFPPGDARRWPEIVAAPRRQADGVPQAGASLSGPGGSEHAQAAP